jgi:hypothetical protein
MIDPLTAKIIPNARGEFFKFTLHAIGKERSNVLVLGEGHMRAFVPGKTSAKGRPDMTEGPGRPLQEQAVLVA